MSILDASLGKTWDSRRARKQVEANLSGQFRRVVPLAKAEGAFVALAAGDALGWPQEMPRRVRGGVGGGAPSLEFRAWTRRSGGRFGLYDETIGAGEYSDDTQLALAVARCRADHGEDWWKAWVRMELPRWTL